MFKCERGEMVEALRSADLYTFAENPPPSPHQAAPGDVMMVIDTDTHSAYLRVLHPLHGMLWIYTGDVRRSEHHGPGGDR